MGVDEEQLQNIIIGLKASAAGHNETSNIMIQMARTFEKIELENGSPKTDEDTGQTMTQARRDEIYDKCIQEAKRLLNPPTHRTRQQ